MHEPLTAATVSLLDLASRVNTPLDSNNIRRRSAGPERGTTASTSNPLEKTRLLPTSSSTSNSSASKRLIASSRAAISSGVSRLSGGWSSADLEDRALWPR